MDSIETFNIGGHSMIVPSIWREQPGAHFCVTIKTQARSMAERMVR